MIQHDMYKGLWHLEEGLSFCVTLSKSFSKLMDIVIASIAKKEGGRGLAANTSAVMSSSLASRIEIK
jgi:hypothetical protein